MLQIIFRTILLGVTLLLLANCANEPEQVAIKDPLNISKPLSAALKEECGIYVPMSSNIASTEEFLKKKLFILGEVEGHMDTRVSGLGMEKTGDFLFKEVLFIYVTLEGDCRSNHAHAKDTPCSTKKDTLESREFQTFIREFRTYKDEKVLNKLFKQNYLDSPDYIFLMTKLNARKFSNQIKELIIE